MQVRPHLWIHPICEVLGYAIGYWLYRRRQSGETNEREEQQRWEVMAAAAIGDLVGSHMLGLLQQAPGSHYTWLTVIMPGGRTTVGGLLGGWVAAAYTRAQGVFARLGDELAAPACIGIAVGRIGCFLAGLADGTEGKPTALPWGVNFGDGIARHPTTVYEILFLVALAGLLHGRQQGPHAPGSVFRLFLAGYLAWRLLIDFIKPEPLLYGMSVIQWTCALGLLVLMPGVMRFLPISRRPSGATNE